MGKMKRAFEDDVREIFEAQVQKAFDLGWHAAVTTIAESMETWPFPPFPLSPPKNNKPPKFNPNNHEDAPL